MRIALTYLWGHGRLPDLANAMRFTEMVQLRKLYDRDPQLSAMMDKVRTKDIVRSRLGDEWVTDTLWSGCRLPARIPWNCPAIVKARHGCNQYRVLPLQPDHRAWQQLQRQTARWTKRPYGGWLDEWAYRDVERGLLAEPLIGDGVTLPVDYKIYVFGGAATHVQVHTGRGTDHRWILHDRAYRQLVPQDERPPAPRSLAAMLDAAETLASGIDFVRVDFYEVEGKPRFAEFCLYPGSGLDPFADDLVDLELGRLWHQAAAPSRWCPPLGVQLPQAV